MPDGALLVSDDKAGGDLPHHVRPPVLIPQSDAWGITTQRTRYTRIPGKATEITETATYRSRTRVGSHPATARCRHTRPRSCGCVSIEQGPSAHLTRPGMAFSRPSGPLGALEGLLELGHVAPRRRWRAIAAPGECGMGLGAQLRAFLRVPFSATRSRPAQEQPLLGVKPSRRGTFSALLKIVPPGAMYAMRKLAVCWPCSRPGSAGH